MQFLLPSNDLQMSVARLSTPFLNELSFLEFGRKNAQMKRFGLKTQANWQGAPSRSSVHYCCISRHRVLSPLFWLLTRPFAYAMQLAS
jgi:hypothetical protein